MLAFEPSITWDIKMMKKVAGMMAGGLFNINLNGSDKVAITTHFDPLIVMLRQGEPVYTESSATVAWSDHLDPDLQTD